MDSGGALDGANLRGVSIGRVVAEEDFEKLEQTNDSAVIDNDIKKRLTIGVDLAEVISKRGNHEDNILLNPEDIINIPAKDATVSLLGEVQRETVLPYRPGMGVQFAVGRAGGFSQNAKRNRVYVVYQNGSVKATSSFLFINFRPKLEPGAIVVVPPKTERQKLSLQETISLTTAVASLTVLIRTLINN
jgi:protein involved in polysaccharide export with SLBB domain